MPLILRRSQLSKQMNSNLYIFVRLLSISWILSFATSCEDNRVSKKNQSHASVDNQKKRDWSNLMSELSWIGFDKGFASPVIIGGRSYDYVNMPSGPAPAGVMFDGIKGVCNKQYSYFSSDNEYLLHADSPISWATESGKVSNFRFNYSQNELRNEYTPCLVADWIADDGIGKGKLEIFPITKGTDAGESVYYTLYTDNWVVWAHRKTDANAFNQLLSLFEKYTGKVIPSKLNRTVEIPASPLKSIGEVPYEFNRNLNTLQDLLNKLILYPKDSAVEHEQVKLQFTIDEKGKLLDVVYKSQDVSPALQPSLSQLIKYLLKPTRMGSRYVIQFTPGKSGVQNVKSTLEVLVTFDRKYLTFTRCENCMVRISNDSIIFTDTLYPKATFCSEFCNSLFAEQTEKFITFNELDSLAIDSTIYLPSDFKMLQSYFSLDFGSSEELDEY